MSRKTQRSRVLLSITQEPNLRSWDKPCIATGCSWMCYGILPNRLLPGQSKLVYILRIKKLLDKIFSDPTHRCCEIFHQHCCINFLIKAQMFFSSIHKLEKDTFLYHFSTMWLKHNWSQMANATSFNGQLKENLMKTFLQLHPSFIFSKKFTVSKRKKQCFCWKCFNFCSPLVDFFPKGA